MFRLAFNRFLRVSIGFERVFLSDVTVFSVGCVVGFFFLRVSAGCKTGRATKRKRYRPWPFHFVQWVVSRCSAASLLTFLDWTAAWPFSGRPYRRRARGRPVTGFRLFSVFTELYRVFFFLINSMVGCCFCERCMCRCVSSLRCSFLFLFFFFRFVFLFFVLAGLFSLFL